MSAAGLVASQFNPKVRLKIGAEELIGETVDVTMSGILVRASRVVPVGSSLRMSLQLSQRMRPIMASGSVVRILGGNQMGIQLHQLTVPDSEKIAGISVALDSRRIAWLAIPLSSLRCPDAFYLLLSFAALTLVLSVFRP